ncbi:MAG: hypothetical protein A2Z46_09175 [Nitrospirae bacterium RBG_19FT_COMBO_55_12]|nr:MAG: hypothetical protein A2Z46_09175 [Nitrospirae bacterium RBG_19FT_COMBO_55_12]
MKKLVIVTVALLMIMGLAGGAFAANSLNSGSMAINVGMGNSIYGDIGVTRITGKYFMDRDMALLAGFGFQSSSGDYDAKFFSFQGGVRKYFKTDELATFAEGKITYEREKIDAPGFIAVDVDVIDFSAAFGAEYFFGKQFSLEGSVGIGFGTQDDNSTNQDITYFGTRTVGVSANFYF